MNDQIEVLIIEDTREASDTIKDRISQLKCSCTQVEDGTTALSIIQQRSFDVIILDIGLPGRNGLEVLAEARRLRPDLAPVIVLTGFAEESLQVKAKELGAFDYITKDPLPTKRLRDAILKAVNSRRSVS